MSNKLYIGGLSFNTTEEELKSFFEQVGTVQSATVIKDKFSGQSKGFGFVEMSSQDEARRAISELNEKTLGERTIKVEEARPPAAGGRPGGRPGGGGYGRQRW
ncbi:MAG TPA: RNA-binding protein [Dehalococcoidia bacterium]|nr:RNA-binding protein [Dehalococcoidia bacterium]